MAKKIDLTHDFNPSRPCKIAFRSTDNLEDEEDSFDFDESDSDLEVDPDILEYETRRERESKRMSNLAADNDPKSVQTETEWRECEVGSTKKNISFVPPRKGVNVDLIPPMSSPLHCLGALFSYTTIKKIIVVINEYKQKKTNDCDSKKNGDRPKADPWVDITVAEMYKFLLVLVSMSLLTPINVNLRFYWGNSPLYDGKWFRRVFKEKRFFQIYDALNKIYDFNVHTKSRLSALVNHVKKKFQTAFYPGKALSVEELVIGSKYGWAQTEQNFRPPNHVVKTCGLVDNETGYIFNMKVYFGPPRYCFSPPKLSCDFSIKLLDGLLSPCCEGHHLCLDKYNSRLPILRHLEQKFNYIGHVDESLHKGIPKNLKTDAVSVGQVRWYMEEGERNLIAKYRDTKYKLSSALISNDAEVKTVRSHGMHMPAMFEQYNRSSKGIGQIQDLLERYGSYNIPVKEWDTRFFRWFFEIIQLNAFVLYKQSQPKKDKSASYRKFKAILSGELCRLVGLLCNQNISGSSVDPTDCLCYLNFGETDVDDDIASNDFFFAEESDRVANTNVETQHETEDEPEPYDFLAQFLYRETIPFPTFGKHDVLLRMSRVGICGSDIKYWTHGYCGMFTVKEPMVIGHEASGTVVKVGSEVKTLQEGDRVAVEPGIPCRQCHLCRTGSYNLCPDIRFCATPPVHGNLCQYYSHPADFCYKLPEGVGNDEGALMEPLAVAVYACRRGNIGSGANVLICGAGPVGLLCLWVAQAAGASRVVMTDIDQFRLDSAKQYGADKVMNVSDLTEDLVAQEVTEFLECGADVTIECSGSDFSMRLGIHACRPGGCVVQVGRGSPTPQIPLNLAATKQVDIKGVFRYANCYQTALNLIREGRLPHLSKLVTHHFKLDDSLEAFKTASTRSCQPIKVIIQCD